MFSGLEKKIIRKKISKWISTETKEMVRWSEGDKLSYVDWSGAYIYDGFYCIQFYTAIEPKVSDMYINVIELDNEIKSIERNKKLKYLLG